MPRKGTMKARVRCPWCNKPDTLLLITDRAGGSGVDNQLYTHGGLYEDPDTGKPLDCKGSGRSIPNRDVPPMSEWRKW